MCPPPRYPAVGKHYAVYRGQSPMTDSSTAILRGRKALLRVGVIRPGEVTAFQNAVLIGLQKSGGRAEGDVRLPQRTILPCSELPGGSAGLLGSQSSHRFDVCRPPGRQQSGCSNRANEDRAHDEVGRNIEGSDPKEHVPHGL